MLLFGQAPIDFMLEGELLNETGQREIVGLRRIEGYTCEVHRLKLPACIEGRLDSAQICLLVLVPETGSSQHLRSSEFGLPQQRDRIYFVMLRYDIMQQCPRAQDSNVHRASALLLFNLRRM